MKSILLLAVALCFFASCKKDKNPGDVKNNGLMLTQISSNGIILEKYDYTQSGLLSKKSWFSRECQSNPTDEFTYTYSGNRLVLIHAEFRSLSSTILPCDKAPVLISETRLEYDGNGRLNKFVLNRDVNVQVTATFFYNDKSQVIERTVSDGSISKSEFYKYDSRGNIIEVTDFDGKVVKYEFDNKINPYFLMTKTWEIFTPYFNSPNNVTKVIYATGENSIRYDYNIIGLPLKIYENGQVFEYHYQ